MDVNLAPNLQRIDAAWLSSVLREGGHCEAEVTEVQVEPVAFTGATTDMARLRLGYGDDGVPGRRR